MTAGTDFGAPPPVSSTSYIGVPGGYGYLPRQNRGGFNVFGALGVPTFGDQSGSVNGAPVAPKYQTGDEFTVASMPPEQLARLQQQLASAGLIGSNTKIRVGIADDATVAAFKSLLGFANVNGLDWHSALSKLMTNPPVDTTPSIEQTSPMDEDLALYSAAQKLLGRDPTPQQLDGFRPYYNALTTTQQTDTLAARQPSVDGTTGGLTSSSPISPTTINDAPNLSSAAEGYLRQNSGLQVQGENLSHVMDALDSIISGAGEHNFGQQG